MSETEGIDILGNMVEASSLSINSNFYGNLHNMGHVFISLVHDPDSRHLVSLMNYFCGLSDNFFFK